MMKFCKSIHPLQHVFVLAVLLAFGGVLQASATPCPLPDDDAALLEIAWPLLDGNGDDVISLAELQALYPLEQSYFNLIDSNRDGRLTLSEVEALLPLVRPLLGGSLLSLIDANGDGLIQYAEVSAYVDRARFDALDANDNGLLDCEDFGGENPGEGEDEGEATEEGEEEEGEAPEGEVSEEGEGPGEQPCPLPDDLNFFIDLVWPVVDTDESGGLAIAEVEAVLPAGIELPIDLESVFQLLDSNSSGEVERPELQLVIPLLAGEDLLSYIDLNGDRLIDYAEVEGYVTQAQFAQVDANDNGVIDCEDGPAIEPEEGEFVEEGEPGEEGEVSGYCPLPNDVHELVHMAWPILDADASGGLSMLEISAWLPADLALPMSLAQLFQLADASGDGEITLDEIMVYLPLLAGEDILGYVDENGDGLLSLEEFDGYLDAAQFAQLDTNQNGVLDCEDMPGIEPPEGEPVIEGELLIEGESPLYCPLPNDIHELVHMAWPILDADASGGIALDEITAWIPAELELPISLEQLFLLGDSNRDGEISLDEISVYLPMLAGEDILSYVDQNGDGLLAPGELDAYLSADQFAQLDTNQNGVLDCEDLPGIDPPEGELPPEGDPETPCPIPLDEATGFDLMMLLVDFDFDHRIGAADLQQLTGLSLEAVEATLAQFGIGEIDTDDDGFVTRQELEDYYHSLFWLMPNPPLVTLIDANRDGVLAYAELADFFEEQQAHFPSDEPLPPYPQDHFNAIDRNANGVLDCEDLLPLEDPEGEGAPETPCAIPLDEDTEFDLLILLVDFDFDQRISTTDFAQLTGLPADELDGILEQLGVSAADADGDGFITRQELEDFIHSLIFLMPNPPVVTLIDANDDGVLAYPELVDFFEDQQAHLPGDEPLPPYPQDHFNAIDRNANGVLDCEDLLPVEEPPEGEVPTEGEEDLPTPEDLLPFLLDLFPLLDADGNGGVTLAEISALLGIPVQVFADLDLNQDGLIQRQEIRQLLDSGAGFGGEGARVTLERSVSGNGFYAAGELLTVEVRLEKHGNAALGALGLDETLPEGWMLTEVLAAAGAEVAPQAGDTGELEFAWVFMPDFPVTVIYTIQPPETATETQVIYGQALYRFSTSEELSSGIIATPLGEGVSSDQVHSADYDHDWSISLSEVLRIIQFFNMDGYQCGAGDTEDGFAPGAGLADCLPHDADYLDGADWRIDLSELLRIIQFFNAPRDAYHVRAGTEDGFAPGAFQLEE